MLLHLLCSNILHLWLLLCANNSAVESQKHLNILYVIFQHLDVLHTLLVFLLYIYILNKLNSKNRSGTTGEGYIPRLALREYGSRRNIER